MTCPSPCYSAWAKVWASSTGTPRAWTFRSSAAAPSRPHQADRTKPTAITRAVADRLGLTLHIQETASPRKAWQNVVVALTAGRPVGLQLDSYHLDYFTTKVHFGAHFAALYGYDDTYAYLIDTAQQGGTVTTTLTSLGEWPTFRWRPTVCGIFVIVGDYPSLFDMQPPTLMAGGPVGSRS